MNPIDRVSLLRPGADSEIHQIISKENRYHPGEINRCRFFSTVYGKGRTSNRTPDLRILSAYDPAVPNFLTSCVKTHL